MSGNLGINRGHRTTDDSVTVSFLGGETETATFTTYSSSGFSLGTAAADRSIIVACFGSDDSGTESVSSATIAGVSATILHTVQSSSTVQMSCEFVGAAVPTGTTGDISIVWDGDWRRGGIAVWAVYGLNSLTPGATASVTTSGAGTKTLDVNTSAGGIILGAGVSNASTTHAWSDTERYDAVVEAMGFSAGDKLIESAGTPTAFSVTTTGGSSTSAYGAIALR